MKSLLAAITLCLTLLAPKSTAASDSFSSRPRDECLHVPGYFELRWKFEDIVRRKDSKALLAMVDSNIDIEIGGQAGKDHFVQKWQLSADRVSPIWPELDKILRLGCYAESDRQIILPQFMALDPHWNDDRATMKALVLGENINLRSGPGTNTSSKALVSWDMVAAAEEVSGDGWIAVTTRDGKSGYIHQKYLRYYWDYRLGFIRQGQKWSINLMVAGD
jgi:uncharacterized protein YgiM (DUF1202 family)